MSNIMNKKYFFLGGMFRSGNTVLSSILNQNPTLYVSPLSPVVEYMWQCDICNLESSQIYANKHSKKNVISKIIENFYEDIDKPIIIDRSKTWAIPENILMIKKYITTKPKIIFTIRPLHESIASHINIMKLHLLSEMARHSFSYNKDISENDNIAEFLLSGNDYALHSLSHSSYIEDTNKKILHIVKFEDLINDPNKTLKNIYDFLEIKNYSHDFKNIKKEKEKLSILSTLPKDLHKVDKRLKDSELDVKDILSKTMIEKCKKIDLFYN